MRRYLVGIAAAVMVLAMSTVGAQATPAGVQYTDSGVAVIGGDVVAQASLPAAAVSYAAFTLGADR